MEMLESGTQKERSPSLSYESEWTGTLGLSTIITVGKQWNSQHSIGR